jgi:hypothetical protein
MVYYESFCSVVRVTRRRVALVSRFTTVGARRSTQVGHALASLGVLLEWGVSRGGNISVLGSIEVVPHEVLLLTLFLLSD